MRKLINYEIIRDESDFITEVLKTIEIIKESDYELINIL